MEVIPKEQVKVITLGSEKELQGPKEVPMKVEDDNEMVSLIETSSSIEDEVYKKVEVINECHRAQGSPFIKP